MRQRLVGAEVQCRRALFLPHFHATDGCGPGGVPYAQALQERYRRRREGNGAGIEAKRTANAFRGSAFEQCHPQTALCERQSSREAHDAGADHRDIVRL